MRAILVLLVGGIAGCSLLSSSSDTDVSRSATNKAQVAIVVSQRIPAYTEVAERIKQRLKGRATIYYMDMATPDSYLAGKGSMQLVTIGLDASRLAAHRHYRQVFCQVFDYTGRDLAGKHSKGVAMLPGIEKTFAVWKALDPKLKKVAVISGQGQEARLGPANKIAEKYGIQLRHYTVKTDKEYLYTFKKLADSVQGYWLVPDNRVLSVEALKDIMNFSVRNGKQVAVFNDELLGLGGLFSVTSDYDEIADKVVLRLKQSARRDDIPGPDLLPLDEAVLVINSLMVKRLGLHIPARYKKYSDERKGD